MAVVKKGPWSRDEDIKLHSYILQNGHGNWQSLPAKAGLQRCGKSCRMRWMNYLRPDIKRGNFTLEEEETIIKLHALLGNRWSAIARHLPMRTDNEVKNYWNTHLKKILTNLGIDPLTHKPNFMDGSQSSKAIANLNHLVQWETARLQAEARLCCHSCSFKQPSPTFTPPLACHGSVGPTTTCSFLHQLMATSMSDNMLPVLHMTSFEGETSTSVAMQNHDQSICLNDATQVGSFNHLLLGNSWNDEGTLDNVVGGFQDNRQTPLYMLV